MSEPDPYVTTTDGASFRSVADVQPIPLYAGEQVWRLVRGNEGDDRTRAEVIDEAAMVMRWALNHGRGSGPPWQILESGQDQWTLGDARPVQIVAASHNLADVALPHGRSYGRRELYPGDGLPAVVASDADPPWWVLVRFWWRGPTDRAAAWPALGFGTAPPTISQLGWMLDSAVVPDVKAPDPGDKSWGKAKVDSAIDEHTKPERTLLDDVATAAKAALLLGGLYVGWKVYRDVRGS